MVALEEAFKHSIMTGKFPSCVLNLELPYEMIDVNVHPSKIEVRFINERPVFDAVFHAVKSALLKFDGRKEAVFKKETAFNDIKKFNPFRNAEAIMGGKFQAKPIAEQRKVNNDFNPFEGIEFESTPKKAEPKPATGFSDSMDPLDLFNNSTESKTDRAANSFEAIPAENTESKTEEPKDFEIKSSEQVKSDDVPEFDVNKTNNLSSADKPEFIEEKQTDTVKIESKPNNEVYIRFIGEAFDTYIIAEKNHNEILLIDKHAAHERMIYEKLKSEKAGAFSQVLLQPITVKLGKNEYTAAVENLEMFAKCCFEVEDFGNSSVIVRSVPQYLDASDAEDSIIEMSDYLAKGKNDIFTEKMDWFYHNVACRSAIKAGNKSSPQELIEIVKKLEANPDIKYCPHGRPVCIVMKKSEIERQFGRV